MGFTSATAEQRSAAGQADKYALVYVFPTHGTRVGVTARPWRTELLVETDMLQHHFTCPPPGETPPSQTRPPGYSGRCIPWNPGRWETSCAGWIDPALPYPPSCRPGSSLHNVDVSAFLYVAGRATSHWTWSHAMQTESNYSSVDNHLIVFYSSSKCLTVLARHRQKGIHPPRERFEEPRGKTPPSHVSPILETHTFGTGPFFCLQFGLLCSSSSLKCLLAWLSTLQGFLRRGKDEN